MPVRPSRHWRASLQAFPMRLTSSPLLFSFSPFLLISLFLLSACTPPPTNTPTPTPLLHLETATPLPPSPTPEPTFRIIGYVTDDVIPQLV
ncbi:MAG TPA: hypothetical protein PK530_25035, partial [Anaerolineales bacterium]|nr:hypothetical protein [Anaerolineales bacterium]